MMWLYWDNVCQAAALVLKYLQSVLYWNREGTWTGYTGRGRLRRLYSWDKEAKWTVVLGQIGCGLVYWEKIGVECHPGTKRLS